MKDRIRNFIFRYGLRWLLEEFPGLKRLNGRKRLIGNILLFIGSLLELLTRYFGAELPQVVEAQEWWLRTVPTLTMVVGAVFDIVGDAHATDKAVQGLGLK